MGGLHFISILVPWRRVCLLASLIIHCFKPLYVNPLNPFLLSPDSVVTHICVHKQKQRHAMFTIIKYYFSLSPIVHVILLSSYT